MAEKDDVNPYGHRMEIFSSVLCIPFEENSTLWDEEEWEAFVKETVEYLKTENDREKDNIHPLLTIVKRNVGVELIWEAFEDFDLPPNCKYMAADLFHRFAVKHCDSLTEYILKNSKNNNKRKKLAKELERRIISQSPLRALTCLMIASKLACNHKRLDARMVCSYIKKLGLKYSTKQILRSEARVLEQLEYKCLHTNSILVYVGVVVAVVGLKTSVCDQLKQVRAEKLYEVSMLLLDSAIFNHEKLYQELYFLVTGSRVICEKLRAAFARIVADRFLLAASTVVGGGWVLGGDSLSTAIMSHIYCHARIPICDLNSMTACILDVAGLST